MDTDETFQKHHIVLNKIIILMILCIMIKKIF